MAKLIIKTIIHDDYNNSMHDAEYEIQSDELDALKGLLIDVEKTIIRGVDNLP